MNKSIFLFSVATTGILLFVGCNDSLFQPQTEQQQPDNMQLRSAGDGKYDLLGYGYDAKGAFADAAYGKAKVIDVEKLAKIEPNRVENGIIGKQYFSLVSGENYRSYTRNLSRKVSIELFDIPFFKNSLNWAFNDESSSSDSSTNTYSYASYDLKIQRKRLTLHADNNKLAQNYVTDIFREDCQLLSPEALIARYGTHVLRDISLGGKLSAAYRSRISEQNKKHVVESGLSFGIKSIFNVSINGSYTDTDAYKNKQAMLSYRTIGGDPSRGLMATVNADGSAGAINIAPWQNSVTLQNAQLIDISETGFIPLHKLVEDYDKRYDLMAHQYPNSDFIATEMLNYALPLHLLPKILPRVDVQIIKGNGSLPDKINIILPAQYIYKPYSTLSFSMKNIPLNADGTFSANNLKYAVESECDGKTRQRSVSRLTGKLTRNANGKYSISFTMEGEGLSFGQLNFQSANLSVFESMNAELIKGDYIGKFDTVVIEGKSKNQVENKTITISKNGENKFNIYLPPFRVGNMPGSITIDAQGITLNADGTFTATNLDNAVILKIGFVPLKYRATLVNGKFTQTANGYELQLDIDSEGHFGVIRIFKAHVHFTGNK